MKRILLSLVALTFVACQDATRSVMPDQPSVPPILADLTVEDVGARLDVPDFGVSSHGADTPENFECAGVVTGTFHNIDVPPGGFCIVVNSTVTGNIRARQDAVMAAVNNQIGGSIFGEGADVLQTRNNTIGGNVIIKNGGPHPVFLEVEVCGSNIPNGHVIVESMTGSVFVGPTFCPTGNVIGNQHVTLQDNVIPGNRALAFRFNDIKGHGNVQNNTGPGNKFVIQNTVSRFLRCMGNSAPFVGGPNSAARTMGQCF